MIDEPSWIRIAGPGVVQRIVVERFEGELHVTMAIRCADLPTIHVHCLRARNIRFRAETIGLTERVVLVARDVTGDGWEGIRYSVQDIEEEFISLVCAAIETERSVDRST